MSSRGKSENHIDTNNTAQNSSDIDNKFPQQSRQETLKVLLEISKLLNTGLDETSLGICYQLLEAGVNPEALALAVKEIRRVADTKIN